MPEDMGYSNEELYSAIRRAHAAGDSNAVGVLTGEIQKRQAAGQPINPSGTGTIKAGPGPQIEGPARPLAQGASALLAGGAGILDLPVHLANMGAAVARSERRLEPFYGTLTNALGLTQRSDLKPQNAREALTTGALEGVGSSIIPFGSMSTKARMLTGAAGGAAAEGAHQLWPNSVVAPLTAAILAGGAVGGANDLLSASRAVKANKQRLGFAEESYQNALDNSFTLGAKARQTRLTAADAALAAFDTGKTAAQNARAMAEAAADQQLRSIGKQMGTSTSLEEAGNVMQNQAQFWLDETLPNKVKTLWEGVSQAIPGTTPTPMHSFATTLQDIKKSAGKLDELVEIIRPKLPDQLWNKFKSIADNPAGTVGKPAKMVDSAILGPDGKPLQKVAAAATSGKPFTWSEVQQLRSAVGDAMRNQEIVAGMGGKNIERLYAALSNDMKASAHDLGEDAAKAFDNANAETTRLYDLARGVMTKVVKSDAAGAAKLFLNEAGRGGESLALLRGELPLVVDELAAAHLATVKGKDWAKLSREGKLALLNNPRSAALLDASELARGAAGKNLEVTMKALSEARKAGSKAASAAEGKIKFNNALMVRAEKQKLKDAKAKAGETGTNWWKDQGVRHGVGALAGGTLGNALGTIGLNAMGFKGSDIIHGDIGTIIGMGLPLLYRGGKTVLANPNQLQYPARGAIAGATTLPPDIWSPVNGQLPLPPQ